MRELQSLGLDIAVYTDEGTEADLMQDVNPRRSTPSRPTYESLASPTTTRTEFQGGPARHLTTIRDPSISGHDHTTPPRATWITSRSSWLPRRH